MLLPVVVLVILWRWCGKTIDLIIQQWKGGWSSCGRRGWEEEDSLWVSSGEVGGKEPGRSGAAEVFFLFSFSSSFWDCWMEGVRVCVCVCCSAVQHTVINLKEYIRRSGGGVDRRRVG